MTGLGLLRTAHVVGFGRLVTAPSLADMAVVEGLVSRVSTHLGDEESVLDLHIAYHAVKERTELMVACISGSYRLAGVLEDGTTVGFEFLEEAL